MLCEEARYLHSVMFRSCPTDRLVDAYVRAHTEIQGLCAIDERQLQTVQLIVTKRLDAVGVEPWLRGKEVRHALCAKMLLIAYLAECDAHHLEFMRGRTDGPIALISMGCAMIMAIFRLLRGYVQKARYGLV